MTLVQPPNLSLRRCDYKEFLEQAPLPLQVKRVTLAGRFKYCVNEIVGNKRGRTTDGASITARLAELRNAVVKVVVDHSAIEQSGHYQMAYASVHLAALRYLLLFEAMLRAGQLSYGEIRDRESGRLQTLTYSALLWHLFRAVIEGALEGLIRDLGRKVVKHVLATIDQTVEAFLNEALQISPQHISAQLEAEEFGYL